VRSLWKFEKKLSKNYQSCDGLRRNLPAAKDETWSAFWHDQKPQPGAPFAQSKCISSRRMFEDPLAMTYVIWYAYSGGPK